tara:strand:+ start:3620 stop:4498 length:879 start_codon:yes stop_codon:yes gene_type:complete
MTNKIYIVDGGVFSPPTRVMGKLAYNMSSYLSKLLKKPKIEYHFFPTNKYYNKPWVRCVDEKDRIHMLNNLINYINNEFKPSKNIKFVVNDYEIKKGKQIKDHVQTIDSVNFFKNKKHVYLANSIQNMISILQGNYDESLYLLYNFHFIVYDIYSSELMGNETTYNYLIKNINIDNLINSSNKCKKDFFKNKSSNQMKREIMKKIIILPKNLVPESYKSLAGNRLREELDVYYDSLQNIQKLTTPTIGKFITNKKLYNHCKSNYENKLISKNNKTKTKRVKHNKTKKQRRRL